MKIYTKFGDKGSSALFDGTVVPKDHLRLDTYGTVDELNSHLGLALVTCTHHTLRTILLNLQPQLLTLGADLATPAGSKNESKIQRISPAMVAALEQQIDAATAQLPPLKHFILPGGSETAARLHVARTVCRRAERLLVTLMTDPTEGIQPPTLIYLNRLSDLLFTLARLANHLDGTKDIEWIP